MASESSAQLRKIKKPMIEKRRRERINECLNQLKAIILEATEKNESQYTKMEKADILEMTVSYLQSTCLTDRATKVASSLPVDVPDSTVEHQGKPVHLDHHLDSEPIAACRQNCYPDNDRQSFTAGYVDCAFHVQQFLSKMAHTGEPKLAAMTSSLGKRLVRHLIHSSPSTWVKCTKVSGNRSTSAAMHDVSGPLFPVPRESTSICSEPCDTSSSVIRHEFTGCYRNGSSLIVHQHAIPLYTTDTLARCNKGNSNDDVISEASATANRSVEALSYVDAPVTDADVELIWRPWIYPE